MGDGLGGIDKVASSWTIRGWSPPWTHAAVTLRGLKSPPTHEVTTENIFVSPIAFAPSKLLPFTFICNDLHSAA